MEAKKREVNENKHSKIAKHNDSQTLSRHMYKNTHGSDSESISEVNDETHSESKIDDDAGSSLYRQEVTTDSTSSDSCSSEKNERKRKRTKKTKKTITKEKTQMEQLIEVVSERLDTRKVPPQEKFDDEGGQDLNKYLVKFEKYCSSNYKGDKSLWIGELERHLTGRVLQAYKAVKDIDDTYEIAKKKLLQWYNNLSDLRKRKHKNKFKNANYIKGETLYFYSTRLEKLFKLAYPSHKIDYSKTLQEKYISTIPKSSRKMISAQVINCKVADQKIAWRMVQKCARLYDAEHEKNMVDSDDKESTEEIIINVGRTNTRQPIATKANDTSNRPLPHKPKTEKLNYQFSQSCNNRGNSNGACNNAQVTTMTVPNLNQNRGFYNNNVARPYQGRGFNNLPELNIIKCSYCGRLGHALARCRKRLRQCFLCGGHDHYFRQCVKFEQQNRNKRSQSVQPSTHRQSAPSYRHNHHYNSNPNLSHASNLNS